MMKVSIVIPARDEEEYIGGCFESIRKAVEYHPCDFEIIVVLNRCTDRTGDIAREHNAKIVEQDGKNLAAIRNAGVAAAGGDVLITIDADSRMSENMLAEVDKAIASGRYIGGGVPIRTERESLGIAICGILLYAFLVPWGISAGMFWCRKEDFDAVGGFDESKYVAEDVDFAVRLRQYGRKLKRKWGTLRKTRLMTSCRKFDKYGEWLFFRLLWRHPDLLWHGFDVVSRENADLMFYEFEHEKHGGGG